jgi:UDP-N-acetylglucosamine acyltransferase
MHQFSKIGRNVMVGGNTRVNSDLPPFFLYSGFNVVPKGLNLVGLRRAGFSREDIRLLKDIYRLLYRSGLKLADAIARIETDIPWPPQSGSGLLHSLVQPRYREGKNPTWEFR